MPIFEGGGVQGGKTLRVLAAVDENVFEHSVVVAFARCHFVGGSYLLGVFVPVAVDCRLVFSVLLVLGLEQTNFLLPETVAMCHSKPHRGSMHEPYCLWMKKAKFLESDTLVHL